MRSMGRRKPVTRNNPFFYSQSTRYLLPSFSPFYVYVVLLVLAPGKDREGGVAQNRESAPFGEVDGRLHPPPAAVANL